MQCFVEMSGDVCWFYMFAYVSCMWIPPNPMWFGFRFQVPGIDLIRPAHPRCDKHPTTPGSSGKENEGNPTRWAPTSYKWGYNPYKWPCKLVTGVITPTSGVINLLIAGRGPPCRKPWIKSSGFEEKLSGWNSSGHSPYEPTYRSSWILIFNTCGEVRSEVPRELVQQNISWSTHW